MEKDIKAFFRSISASSRQARKAAYELLIAQEKGEVPFKAAKMPWMLPAWERGLTILNEVIAEVDNEIKESTTPSQRDSKLLTAEGGCQAHRSLYK